LPANVHIQPLLLRLDPLGVPFVIANLPPFVALQQVEALK
jgi:hypothetical protein